MRLLSSRQVDYSVPSIANAVADEGGIDRGSQTVEFPHYGRVGAVDEERDRAADEERDWAANEERDRAADEERDRAANEERDRVAERPDDRSTAA